MVVNATFNNTSSSAISWRSVLFVEETGENHPPAAPCLPSHLGTWLCEGGGHGSEAAVSGKLV
jgi:hypothetical protein